MKGKKLWMVCAALAILAASACALGACDFGGGTEAPGIEVTDWTKYIETAATVVARQYGAISFDREIGIDIGGHAIDIDSGERFDLTIKANFDPLGESTADAGVVRVASKGKGEAERLIYEGVLKDGVAYVDRLNWDTGKRVKNKYADAPFFDALSVLLSLEKEGEETIFAPDMIFRQFANLFFFDCTPNAYANELTFEFDFKRGISSAAAKKYFEKIPLALRKMTFSIFGVEDYDGLVAAAPEIQGQVTLKLAADKIDEISARSLRFAYDGEVRYFDVDVDMLAFANHYVDGVERYWPSDPDEYREAGQLCGTLGGKVNLLSGDEASVSFDYSLRYNVDLLRLIASKGDLAALGDDSWFHLRVSHTCDGCGWCGQKYEPSKGAIFDIAFAPKDFGTHFVYVSVGLKALLGEENLSPIIGGFSLLANVILPEYKLLQIDPSLLADLFAGAQGTPSSGGEDVWSKLWDAIRYDEKALSIDLSPLVEIFGLDDTLRNVFDAIRIDRGATIDRAQVSLTERTDRADEYDVMREAVHLYGKNIAGAKQYEPAIYFNPSMTAKMFYFDDTRAIVDADAQRDVVRIYNDRYADGIMYDGSQSICANELSDLIGSQIAYSTLDVYGNESAKDFTRNRMTIVGYDGVDRSLIGAWQQMTLYVVPKYGLDLPAIHAFDRIQRQKVVVWIKLGELTNISFHRDEQTTVYDQGQVMDATVDDLTRAKVRLYYADGSDRDVIVYPDNASEIFKLYDRKQSICVARQNVALRYDLFGFGKTVNLIVRPAKSYALRADVDKVTFAVDTYQSSTAFEVIYVDFATASGNNTSWKLPFSSATVEGYPIASINGIFDTGGVLNASGIRFTRTGKYVLENYFLDLRYSIEIEVTPVSDKKSSYAVVSTTNQDRDYYVGSKYSFSALLQNSYHGTEGMEANFEIRVSYGFTDSYGGTAYLPLDMQEPYYRLESASVDLKNVELPYLFNLPATILSPIALKSEITFLTAGKYRIELYVGSNSCKIFVDVDDRVDRAVYSIIPDRQTLNGVTGEKIVLGAVLTQTNGDVSAIGAQAATFKWSVREGWNAVATGDYAIDGFTVDGNDGYRKFTFLPQIDPMTIAANFTFRRAGNFTVTLTMSDASGRLASCSWMLIVTE